MLATWQEQFEEDAIVLTEVPTKLLSFERCLWLIMAVVSIFWLIEYRTARLSFADTKDNALTPTVSITLFQTKPHANVEKQKAELAGNRSTAETVPPLSDSKPTANEIKEPIATSVKTTSSKTQLRPSITPSIPTSELLEEAISLHSQSSSTNTFTKPENSKMFDSRLEKQLQSLRKEGRRQPGDSARLKKYASTIDSHGDLRVRAGNGCIFRRDDSGGVLDGTWYAEGCQKEETISLKLPETLRVPKPSFQIK